MGKGYLPVIFLITLALCGCGDSTQPLPPAAQPRQTVAPAKVSVEELSAEEAGPTAPEYVYNSLGRRDPFVSPMEIRRLIVPEDTPLTPLQNYDLSQLRLTGVIVGMKKPKAMISSPDGKNFIVELGTKIGKNNGVVVEINRDGVLAEEVYYDFSGEIRKSIQSIQLPKREGVE